MNKGTDIGSVLGCCTSITLPLATEAAVPIGRPRLVSHRRGVGTLRVFFTLSRVSYHLVLLWGALSCRRLSRHDGTELGVMVAGTVERGVIFRSPPLWRGRVWDMSTVTTLWLELRLDISGVTYRNQGQGDVSLDG